MDNRMPQQPAPPGALGASVAPSRQGLYDPRFEHDACGVSFVVDMHGRPTHRMVELGLGELDKSGVAELTFPGRSVH